MVFQTRLCIFTALSEKLKRSLTPLPKKGSVTSLASLFPVEEVQKVAKRIEDTIADKQSEINRVRGFVVDKTASSTSSTSSLNSSPTTSWFRLGKQHSSQVLLGEGYYAERTSKQTVEILQRRGKSLDSRVDSLEANIKDPEAEASFLNATASFLVARFFWEKGIMLNF
ncbi:RNA polymerase II subunit 5-mediating [Glycine max]|nr:RNA polymerase II subunit 5-mediating [Glycine max]KAH1194196.1 RNA polymerase II subunit 5-mediating [Glycine max]